VIDRCVCNYVTNPPIRSGSAFCGRERRWVGETMWCVNSGAPPRIRGFVACLVATLIVAACGSSGRSYPATVAPSLNGLDRLVDIGQGRHIETTCRGSGGPAVLLDAGLGNTYDVWNAVIDHVSAFTTVCAYNRASLGRSEPRPVSHGAESDAADLHALVTALHLPPPYIIVGASFGGLGTQLFARRHPAETAGVVLVDAIAPGWDDRLEAMLTPKQVADRRAIPNGEDVSNEDIRASERDVAAGPAFPPVPLVVLRHGQPFDVPADWPRAKVEALWAALQNGLVSLSPTSALLVATSSGHRIHQQQPDLVADAIHAVVDPSRWPPTAAATAAPSTFGDGAPPASLDPGGGLLAFSSGDGIHVARLDGSGDRLVIPATGFTVGEPSLDRTARLVAYTRTARVQPGASGPQPEMPSEVWILDRATGKTTRLATEGILPAVAPDGSLVAFAWHGEAFVVGPNGTGRRDLGEGGCPVWSPDSRRLAMCTSEDKVFVQDLATGQRSPIETGPPPTDPGAWSPDGASLALTSSRTGDAEVYVIDAAGGNERRVTTAPGNQSVDAWLPGGLLVTSSAPDAEVSDWFLVNSETGAAAVVGWLHGRPNPIAYAPG
jgi:pimeloyl-ACP methyl ester carboxylesterase